MKKIKKILVATDFSDNSDNAFRYALWFASKCEADIHLLHVAHPEPEEADMVLASELVTTKKAEGAKVLMQMQIERNSKGFNKEEMPEIEIEIREGIPSTLISEIALDNKIDLLIMGAKGEHKPLDRSIGNVTFSTMDFAACPVLIIPEGVDTLQMKSVAYATDLVASDPFHIWQASKLLKPFDPVLRVVHVKQEIEEDRVMDMKDIEAFFKGNISSGKITFHTFVDLYVKEKLDNFIKNWEIDLLIMNRPNRSIIERIFHSSLTQKTALHTHIPFLVLK